MIETFKIFSFGESVEREKSEEFHEEMEEKAKNRDQREKPPEDDHCPICFGDFTIPCRTNCGHWFCATCILQLWNYRSTVQRCKCPICCRPISKLVPKDSLFVQEEEDAELLRDIQRYNHLYVGGVCGVFLKLVALPLLMPRVLGSLMSKLIDPDHVKLNCYVMRLFADVWEYGDYLTSVLWPWWPFSISRAYSIDGRLGVM